MAVSVPHRSDGASAAASSPKNDFVKNYRAPDALVDFHTDRDSLALGALADCAGFRSVSGSLGGSQCRAHAKPCARTLGIAGEDWVAGVLA